MITFNKIVNKLLKKKGGIILLSDIEEMIDPENARGKTGKQEVYKCVYRLKSEGILFPLRNGLFYIQDGNLKGGKKSAESRIISENYWKIIRAYIRKEAGMEAIIAGSKGLEYHLKDMSIPNNLIVYTKDIQKKVTISKDLAIHFRGVEKSEKRGSAFTLLKTKFSFIGEVEEKLTFRFLVLEAALLDALLIHRGTGEVDEYLVQKFLKRYHASIDRDILGRLVEIRYISSINRLREMAKKLEYQDLYEQTLSVIKKEGAGCFLTFSGT